MVYVSNSKIAPSAPATWSDAFVNTAKKTVKAFIAAGSSPTGTLKQMANLNNHVLTDENYGKFNEKVREVASGNKQAIANAAPAVIMTVLTKHKGGLDTP